MWAFCTHSLLREYGWQFLGRLALAHPLRTARAMLKSATLDVACDVTTVSGGAPGGTLDSGRSIVGVGFCMKPLDPPCPSGRANHDCQYLERGLAAEAPPACRLCAIREIGVMALDAGAAFYVMTSARDILLDVFMSALEQRRFSSGLFVMCRYSLRPFAVGLLASGIRGWLFPFDGGDCRDYRTWLEADRGIKDEQTTLNPRTRTATLGILARSAKGLATRARFERRGNVLHPRAEASPAASR
jgi:hypothetical protein